jgi:uncharacterized YccA/Bax inhibitor family protein
MQSTNPVFAGNPYARAGYADDALLAGRSTTMTVQGTIVKTFVLFAILLSTAAWTWNQVDQRQLSGGLLMGALIVGFVVSMITIFTPKISMYTAPVYAAAEGVFLGAISNIFEQRYPGIAAQAISLTMATMFTMLILYLTGLVKVTDRLITGIVAATGAVALVYIVAMLMSVFGHPVSFINQPTKLGIGFSLVVVGIAAFNLLLDFEFISRGARSGAPKYMEWYTAFGLMVTLVWLYLEIIRLLSKLKDR